MPASVAAINWDTMVETFAALHEMTVRDALKWLSDRDSLQTIAELLQAEMGETHAQMKPILADLETWLRNSGHTPPSEMFGQAGNYTRGEYATDELWRWRYINLRLVGWTRDEARRIMQTDANTFNQRLKRWKLFHRAHENEVLSAWKN